MPSIPTRRARTTLAALALIALPAAAAIGWSVHDRTPLDGAWHGIVLVDTVEVPFRFEIGERDGALVASFFDGDRRIPSAPGTRDGTTVVFTYPSYAATLTARVVEGRLEGQYARGTRPPLPFRATRTAEPAAKVIDAATVPSIAGLYVIPVQSPKGETAWRFIVRQQGADVTASILRVDGDTGALTGRFDGTRFVLSHFSGARPLRLDVSPNADGTLTLVQNRSKTLTAIEAGTAGLPVPTDSAQHTIITDRSTPLRFSFTDLDGRVVTDQDPRLRGKVVVISLTGSWCPNCHDEAPFLVELRRAYHAQGLEVVAFSFEEAEQLADPSRLRAFVAQYGIEYPVLLAGLPSDAPSLLPQVSHLDAFPTTLFLGRDGRVRATHTGFPSAASGEFYVRAREQMTATVERLLLEGATE